MFRSEPAFLFVGPTPRFFPRAIKISARLAFVIAFVSALDTQLPLARAGECDKEIDAGQFQDNGWKPKDKKDKKPPHRLKPAVCEGCQKFVDDLQNALDDCNASQLKEAKDTKVDYSDTSSEGTAKQKARQDKINEATDALGGKAKEPPKGKTKDDLKKEVKKKWDELKAKLNSCPNAQSGTAPQQPGGGEEQPPTGESGQPSGGGGQASAPKPNITIPKMPDCFKTQKEKDDFINGLSDERQKQTLELSHERKLQGVPDRAKMAQLRANIDALNAAIEAAEKIPVPCPSPTPQDHGMAPKQPGKTGETCAALISAGKIMVESVGTGETIGHVADLKIQNVSDQAINCVVPPMILESGSGKNQHYACPSGQTVALNPHQTKTVPMNGVCLNRNKPPVAKGVSGDLVVNEANPTGPQNPNSHIPPSDAGKLLRSCAAKYAAAEQLQKSGALKNLPYHDPQKQKDIIVQWSTWTDPQVCNIVGAPPATKEDLKKVVYKQVEEQGPMTPATKKKVDQGIDTIFEKVELTTAKAKDLEEPEKEIPPVAVTKLAGTPSSGQPVSAPTAAPGESVAATPTAVPQGPGGTTTEPTATPTPCKEDPLALPMAKDLVSAAVQACKDLDRLDREAGEAEDAADADDATPTGKEAKAKADKAAAAAKAAKEIADDADASAQAAAKAQAKDAKAKARDAEAKRKKAHAAADAAEAAESPLRKKADEARKKVMEAVGAKWDAVRAAKDAIKKLKCPENIDKLTETLKDACEKRK